MTHLSPDQRKALQKLYNHREHIEDILVEISTILKVHFPKSQPLADQHWIPQIKTALRDNTKYLPRGEYSMDYTLNQLIDQIIDELDNNKGVSKYI